MTTSIHAPWRPGLSGKSGPLAVWLPRSSTSRATVRSSLRSRRAFAWEISLDALAAAVAAAPHAALWLVLVYPLLWVVAVGASRGYESRLVPPGREDVRRVVRAGVGITVTGAALSVAAAAPLPATNWLALTTATVAMSLAHRGVERMLFQRSARTRVVVAGRAKQVRRFLAQLDGSSHSRFDVVGVCVPKGRLAGSDVDVTLGLENLPEAAASREAEAVILLPGRAISPRLVRRLGWRLGDAGIQLFFAPGLVDVDEVRTTVLSTGPAAMVHVRAAELSGARRAAADLVSRFLAALLLVVLAPVLGTLALLVKLDSPGPVFYRQVRIGRDSMPFVIWKFRTMENGADARLPELYALNESDGLLFKIRRDPRVTRVGAWLRRYSLDELPQLINVVLGTMTFVGPRPALPGEVARYDDDVRRRLAVKPGITGLWQVSGRSDLSWDQGVRLDLRYVDNWSLMLDLRILARTVRAVLRPAGAY